MIENKKNTEEEKLLAAMVYGEASHADNIDEKKAIAAVLVRQMKARGYSTLDAFTKGEKTYAFIVSDGNTRYTLLKKSSDEEIHDNIAMNNALLAARNAISGGDDPSNGAYFWDGADIKSNYNSHFKVQHGIKFTKPEHNIYNIKESTKIVKKTKTEIIKKKVKGKITTKTETVVIDSYDHVYDLTAAYGGTIFWKNNPEYIRISKGKEYK